MSSSHPIIHDSRRRSLLNPFMTASAAIHWQKHTSASKININEIIANKTPSLLFLKDVALSLSDPTATEVDHVVALSALIRALTQSKTNQGTTASQIFAQRLVPIITQIASDRTSLPRFPCSQCQLQHCMAATSAKRHAAITVLCGIVTDHKAIKLSLQWGLVVLLLDVAVRGYLKCCHASILNAAFRKKYRGLAPNVAIDPEASHVNVDSDECYRLPILCLRSLRSLTKHYFSKGDQGFYNSFTLQQTQLIRGGLLGTVLEMQQSITGPSTDPSLITKRKIQSSSYQLIKVFPDDGLKLLMKSLQGNSSKKASRRCSLPEPPIMSNPSSDTTNTKTPTHTSKTPKKFTVIKMLRRKDSTMLNNRNNNNISNINVQRNSKTKKQKPSTPLMPSLTLLGIFAEDQLTEATKQLEMRVKKRIPGRPQTVVVHVGGPSALFTMSIDYLPAAVRHQLDHMDVVAKKTLGLGAMLESGGSSLIKERAAEQRKSTSNGRAERTEQRIQQDAIQDNSSTTLHSKEALHYLTTPSLCDTYVNTQSKTDNEELSRAQLEFAKEEAEKARLRQEQLDIKRRQLRKDAGAMRLRMVDDVAAKKNEKDKAKLAAQKMREENLKRKRLEARLKLEIFQKQQEQIAKLRGDLERAALKKEFDKRNLLRSEFDFKMNLIKNEKLKKLKEKRLIDHHKRQIKHQYHTMVSQKLQAIEEEKIRRARQIKGEARTKKYAIAEAKEKRQITNEKFKIQKLLMKDARVKRIKIEKKASFSYKSKEARWYKSYDETNDCVFWEREAGLGSKGDNYTYESPFEPKWIDIYEEYHELWYKYNIQTEETTLWNEIEKKRKGFNQFAAARPPSTPIDVSLDQIAEDLDNPSCGIIWNAPNDSGDQPMEHCQIEGAAIAKEEENIVDLNQYNWIVINDYLPLDCDYYEIHSENFHGFSEMVSARALQSMAGAPKPTLKFIFRIAYFSSVGIGEYGYTERMDLSLGLEEDLVVEEVVLPVISNVPMPSRRRKMKKGHVDMYQFKF